MYTCTTSCPSRVPAFWTVTLTEKSSLVPIVLFERRRFVLCKLSAMALAQTKSTNYLNVV